jgi:clan AA aspartic protease (TIGR02281 family)
MSIAKIIVLILSLSCFALFPLNFADVVHLKNGKQIEGLIVSKDSAGLWVDVGFGTMKLDKSQISRIERADSAKAGEIKAQWSKDFFSLSRFVPASCKDISQAMDELEASRARAIYEKRNKKEKESASKELKDRLQNVDSSFLQANAGLKKASPNQDPLEYNKAVVLVNHLRAEMLLKQDTLKGLENDIASPSQELLGYMKRFQDFTVMFTEKKKILSGPKVSTEEKEFVVQVEKHLKLFQADFTNTKIQVSSFNGKHISLPVSVNGVAAGQFLVDTGASMVVLSLACALAVGVNLQNANPIEVVVADGRRVAAKQIMLKSVAVGTAKAMQVAAAVIEAAPGADVQGLLGMSFLGNFIVRMDAKSNTLELTSFDGK